MISKRTCLYDRHVASGVLITPFAGFGVLIQYTGITNEYNAVREHCGAFDVSHMGEVIVSGLEADKLTNHTFTNDVDGPTVGKMSYGMICYPDGGAVDDTYICKLDDHLHLMTISASNIDKDTAWVEQNTEGFDAIIESKSKAYSQLAIQGPRAGSMLEDALGPACRELKLYEVKHLQRDGTEVIVSCTGYTGKDGFKVYGTPEYIVKMWDKLVEAGAEPCGLGCRDTLYFKVGMSLYDNELSDKTTPVVVGLSMLVKLDKEEFIGKEALLKQEAEGVSQCLHGIELSDGAIPRHGYEVLKDGVEVGEVTTGYHLISVDEGCAAALVEASVQLDGRLEIQIRGKVFPDTAVRKKSYENHYKK